MQIIRDYQFASTNPKGASVAIGNFDGVHRGHQAVIELARSWSASAPLGIMTFEPHPREFFAPGSPDFRLMNAEAKANRLEKLGVDVLYELNFNAALSSLSAEAFAKDVIAEGLEIGHIVVGSDFCFGKGRSGTAKQLVEFGKEFGFETTIASLVQTDSIEISSTNIRKALSNGQPQVASEMLGHWHRIEGTVIAGEQRGRELGYPTANISIDGLHQPKFGVYAVLIDILDGPNAGSYQGAASIGVRPMFGDNLPNCETFIFDFAGDVYGATVSVALVEFLRGEEKFDSLDALIAQMEDDCTKARAILKDKC